MFRRRDHESFIGGYDPEREMPDPDREYRDRYQSDAYRHNAADSRWAYRWNPDRFEDRFGPRRGEPAPWDRDARDRGYDYDRGMEWDRMRYGYPRGPEPGGYRDRDPRDFAGPRDYGYRGYDRGYDRDIDRDRGADRDRWEYDRWEYGDRDRDSGWRGRGGRY
jgi:hypothetical protein